MISKATSFRSRQKEICFEAQTNVSPPFQQEDSHTSVSVSHRLLLFPSSPWPAGRTCCYLGFPEESGYTPSFLCSLSMQHLPTCGPRGVECKLFSNSCTYAINIIVKVSYPKPRDLGEPAFTSSGQQSVCRKGQVSGHVCVEKISERCPNATES